MAPAGWAVKGRRNMDVFWFIPFLLAALIGIWVFYHKVMREGGSGIRTTGRVLLNKPRRKHKKKFAS
jgi:hypothetical protein